MRFVYGNMPVCREYRYFIEDGRYCCSHPYWPMDTIETQPYTSAAVALGIGWLLERMHRPL
jgi:hypothetical protein